MVKNKKNKNQDVVLVVAAHPDDEILGCGGSICKWRSEGKKINILIMAEGITSRPDTRSVKKYETELRKLREKSEKVGKIIGANTIDFLGLPDNRMDTLPLLDIIKKIEKKVDKLKPNTVLTHHAFDLNIDHRITYEAVITACRPVNNLSVKKILSFEIPSSTDWALFRGKNFQPNYFIDISKHIKDKINYIKYYDEELRNYPHSRSIPAIKALASVRGTSCGVKYAEGFYLNRFVD